MTSSHTFVSAFISDVNANRSLDEYIALADTFLAINIPKVIFLDQKTISRLPLKHVENSWNHIIPFERSQLTLDTKLSPPDTANVAKDTLEYLAVMNQKTFWVRDAIVKNVFQTSHFVWLDFGLAHVFDGDVERYANALHAVAQVGQETLSPRVRIAGIWNMDDPIRSHASSRSPLWFFAGGVFGGSAHALVAFAVVCQEYLHEMANLNGKATWEVNLWYKVWQANRELFDIYSSDHDPSILESY